MTPQSFKSGDCLITPFRGRPVITAHRQPALRLPGEREAQRRAWKPYVAVFFLFALWLTPTPTNAVVSGVELVAATNDARAAQGLSPLRHDERLDHAAALKADDMFAQQYFDHRSPTGVRGWRWMSDAGYAYTEAGENLAKDFAISQDVVTAWMGSDGHRQNMISQKFTDVGVAAVAGTYNGTSTTMIVMLFGRQSSISAATVGSAPAIKTSQPQPVREPIEVAPADPLPTPTTVDTTPVALVPSIIEPAGMPVPDLTFTLAEPSPKYSLTPQPEVLGAETALVAESDAADQTSAIATLIFSWLIVMGGFLSLAAFWRMSIYPQAKNDPLPAQA